MEDFLLNLIPSLKKEPEDYRYAILRRYKSFIEYSQIPSVCYGFDDKSIVPNRLESIYKNIYEAVEGRYNFLFDFGDYKNLSYLTYIFLQKYFVDCYKKEKTIEDIIYIDTKLLVEDYKRLIEFKEEKNSLKPVHDLKILYSGIEEAPLVIWDKITKLDSHYDRDKINDIINIRQRKGLGNFYYSAGGLNHFLEKIGQDNAATISLDLGFDCSMVKINLPNKKEVDLFR